MSDLVNNLVIGLAILIPGIGLGAAIAYLMAGPPPVGPGTRVWHLRDIGNWIAWKTRGKRL